jgi:hypothetical protein
MSGTMKMIFGGLLGAILAFASQAIISVSHPAVIKN